jgi:aspartate racemase
MPAVRKVGLYGSGLARQSMAALFPDETREQSLLAVIRAVKAGAVTDAVRRDYAAVADALAAAGAHALLIACTELSVLGCPEGCRLPAMDALDALVEATVRMARGS